jgi:hypothetical protein
MGLPIGRICSEVFNNRASEVHIPRCDKANSSTQNLNYKSGGCGFGTLCKIPFEQRLWFWDMVTIIIKAVTTNLSNIIWFNLNHLLLTRRACSGVAVQNQIQLFNYMGHGFGTRLT